MIRDIIFTLIAVLPPWFVIFLLAIFAVSVIIILIKIIAFVLDAIPFL